MLENSTNGNQTANDQTAGMYYYQIGANSALKSNASLVTIESSLDSAYSEFQKKERNLNAERIQQYQNEVSQITADKNKLLAEVREIEVKKEFQDNQIQDKKDELIKVRAEGAEADFLPFGIGTLILILLTLYLFIFYSSTGYTALFGLPTKLIGGFLSTTVYNDALNAGGGAIAFVVLFPMIFLAVGFGIHISIENKRYILLAFLLLFTLVFDILLAFRIAKSAHEDAYQNNKTDVIWDSNLAYSDINFWIIIASGFVVYIIWGYLLNYVINEWNRIQPDKMKQVEIERLQQQILTLMSQLATYENQISLSKNKIQNFEEELNEKQKKINILRGGGVVVDVTALRGMVGEFINGWNAYITFKFVAHTAESQLLRENSSKLSNQWLENKIEKLND